MEHLEKIQLKHFLDTHKFYVFVVLLSIIGVHWSFTYMAARQRVLFSYAMWGLFLFYVIAFFVLGLFSLQELVDQYSHRRKLRKVHEHHQNALVEEVKASSTLTLAKADKLPSSAGGDVTHTTTSVVTDLSEAVKVKPVYPLLETIVKQQRILVVGGQGSGKTQIMLWIAQEKLKLSPVIAVDTHASPGKWPAGAHVLGFGLDYDAAQRGFNQVIALMGKRYSEIGSGKVREGEHKVITVLSDEWTDLPDWIPNFKRHYVKPFFTKARKANVDLSLAAHDDTAEALGMEGMAKLKKSFDVIVYCEKVANQYTTFVKYGLLKGAKIIECLPPGPFIYNGQPTQPQTRHVDFTTVTGVLVKDIRVLEAMRDSYDVDSDVVWKQKVRKQLQIPASQEGYKIIDDIAGKYNIAVK